MNPTPFPPGVSRVNQGRTLQGPESEPIPDFTTSHYTGFAAFRFGFSPSSRTHYSDSRSAQATIDLDRVFFILSHLAYVRGRLHVRPI